MRGRDGHRLGTMGVPDARCSKPGSWDLHDAGWPQVGHVVALPPPPHHRIASIAPRSTRTRKHEVRKNKIKNQDWFRRHNSGRHAQQRTSNATAGVACSAPVRLPPVPSLGHATAPPVPPTPPLPSHRLTGRMRHPPGLPMSTAVNTSPASHEPAVDLGLGSGSVTWAIWRRPAKAIPHGVCAREGSGIGVGTIGVGLGLGRWDRGRGGGGERRRPTGVVMRRDGGGMEGRSGRDRTTWH